MIYKTFIFYLLIFVSTYVSFAENNSLEKLNGVEYGDYIVFNQTLLDCDGRCVASFDVEDFSLEAFEADLNMLLEQSKAHENDKNTLRST